jgi:hypothetical protein
MKKFKVYILINITLINISFAQIKISDSLKTAAFYKSNQQTQLISDSLAKMIENKKLLVAEFTSRTHSWRIAESKGSNAPN